MLEKHCYAIGGRINFNYDTVSLCHGIDIGDRIIWNIKENIEFTPLLYRQRIDELIVANNSKCPVCSGCSNLIEGFRKSKKIDIITINPMYFCQCRCVYCGNFRGDHHSLYDPLPIIKSFIDEGMISDNCLFDWGGGEPTISEQFEEIFQFLLKNGYMQRVNTNAIEISDIVLNHMDNELVSLRISLDSGNADTYLSTKGRNMFNRVVENIKRYRSKSENILLKYVITNTNSDEKSIEDFIRLSADMGIRAICIDTDMLSYGWDEYPDLLRFTEKELNAAHLLRKLAHENGLKVQIGYVWTARNNDVPSRDFNQIQSVSELIENNETYALPDELSEFHRKRIAEFAKGIVPKVLASFETLYSEFRDKKIILYGAGHNGKHLLQCLRKFGMDAYRFCDREKEGMVIDGVTVCQIGDVIETMDNNTVIIITPYCVKDIIREFNEKNYEILRGKLYYIDEFRYSDRVLEEME
ncbi:Radical SAM superfamily protein [Lachnospiraceae bacterium C10]|nr:Radical SAM superfamily protein [Lachnospiraceae bacterium C10]